MMQDPGILTAIDVGTTKVCTIIGRKAGWRGIQVLGHAVVPCEGLSKGEVADVAATERAVRASVQEASQKAEVAVHSAYVGVTGTHVSFENRSDKLGWVGRLGVITANELMRVPETVAATSVGLGRSVIHALPMTYTLDGRKGIRDPVGMHAQLLEVETHVVTGASYIIEKLVEAVENAGVTVEGLVLEPLASSEAVLTPEERREGVVLVDIGGGTTDVVVFKKGSIGYTSVIPVAGYQFTNDICVTYNTSYPAAEAAKLKYAHTDPTLVRPNEVVLLPVFGRRTEVRVPRREICQLTRERAQELICLLKLKLQEANLANLSQMRLVLTGGTASLPGLKELVGQTLTSQVRIGAPNGSRGIPQELKAPAYATGVGIMLWAVEQRQQDPVHASNGHGGGADQRRQGLVSRFFNQAKHLLPKERSAVR